MALGGDQSQCDQKWRLTATRFDHLLDNYIRNIKPAKYNNYMLTTGGKDFSINDWKYIVNPMNEAKLNNGSDGVAAMSYLDEIQN